MDRPPWLHLACTLPAAIACALAGLLPDPIAAPAALAAGWAVIRAGSVAFVWAAETTLEHWYERLQTYSPPLPHLTVPARIDGPW